MNLETVSTKHLNELEQQTHELLIVLRKANLQTEDVYHALQQFELEVGRVRRARFDAANPEYSGY